jgi:hypothetical protein
LPAPAGGGPFFSSSGHDFSRTVSAKKERLQPLREFKHTKPYTPWRKPSRKNKRAQPFNTNNYALKHSQLQSTAGSLRRIPVVFHMSLRGFRGMMRRVMMMTARKMGMVRRKMMVPGFMMLRRFAMMTRRVLMMFGCFVVMLNGMLGHMSS